MIAYHIEGGETFKLTNNIPLSMKTLHDNRPLFLCSNPKEWFPYHLKDKSDYRVLEVTFIIPEHGLSFKHCDKYHELFWYSIENNKYIYSSVLEEHISNGFHIFVLDEDNDQKELSEIMLINPSKYVTSIMDITSL